MLVQNIFIGLSLIVGIVAIIYARHASRSAAKSAGAAVSQDHRERRPVLRISPPPPLGRDDTKAIFRVILEGPQDLDRVVIHSPGTETRILFGLAVTGRDKDFLPSADFGPAINPQGSNPEEIRCRVTRFVGDESWDSVETLPQLRYQPWIA